MLRLLDDGILDQVYRSSVRDVLFGGASPASAPRVVIVGGQPGAGKTAATLDARRELSAAGEGVAFINGDELRPYHPRYEQLLAEDPATAADRTGADVGLWVERGIAEAASRRYHSVIETTMRQPDVVARTAAGFASAGFRVELRVVVVDPEISRLGIYQRYARAIATPQAIPRFTLSGYHEDALARMPATLGAVGAIVDEIRFVNRQGAELYRRSAAAIDPASSLRALQRAALPEAEVLRIARAWARLAAALDRDGVPALVREGVRAQREGFLIRSVEARARPSPVAPKVQQRTRGGPER